MVRSVTCVLFLFSEYSEVAPNRFSPRFVCLFLLEYFTLCDGASDDVGETDGADDVVGDEEICEVPRAGGAVCVRRAQPGPARWCGPPLLL